MQWILNLAFAACVAAQTSNLPYIAPGIFQAAANISIDAPLLTVWNVILDFPAYPDWNPFVRSVALWLELGDISDVQNRSQVVADALGVRTADQTPGENRRLWIQAQIPPLPSPVNSDTPSNPLHSELSFENITHIDTSTRRIAWRTIMLPQPLLDAERWQALSTTDDGKTFYESVEVYRGPVSYVVDLAFAQGLQEGFEAQAAALKDRTENS
ncbi:hypothetical protein H0H93_016179 [Arthromyces matolae]|nr:hypothetical protein H0H93_016179 [Arthromyces matolae]